MVQYTVDAWGRSVPVQRGFTPAYQGPMSGHPTPYGGQVMQPTQGYTQGPLGNPVTVGNTYSVAEGATSGDIGWNQAQVNEIQRRDNDRNSTDMLADPFFNPAGIGKIAKTPAEKEAYRQSFARKSAGLPGFIPGSTFINAALGADKEETLEERARREYIQANPGQSPDLGNYYLGTGKWEPYHPTNVAHTQVNTNTSKPGESNESGLGRNTNVDRHGNQRTDIPDEVKNGSGSAYWNSTTGAWTDKATGVPLGGTVLSQGAKAGSPDTVIANQNATGSNDSGGKNAASSKPKGGK